MPEKFVISAISINSKRHSWTSANRTCAKTELEPFVCYLLIFCFVGSGEYVESIGEI